MSRIKSGPRLGPLEVSEPGVPRKTGLESSVADLTNAIRTHLSAFGTLAVAEFDAKLVGFKSVLTPRCSYEQQEIIYVIGAANQVLNKYAQRH